MKLQADREDFLVIDVNFEPAQMRCLCCGDSYPINAGQIDVVIAVMNSYRETHLKKGCSQEKYLHKRLLEEL